MTIRALAISLLAHPGLILIGAALLISLLRGPLRSGVPVAALLVALAAPLAALVVIWLPREAMVWHTQFLGYELTPFAMDKLSRLFATIFALMAFGGTLFALNQESRVELPAALLYAGSAIGVALAGDLITLFVFWELMAIGSTLVIWSAGTQAAYRASRRYLMIHLLGGTLLLIGVAGYLLETGNASFHALSTGGISRWIILAAFLINAGAPPFSAWLPDAYPEASWSGTVFLSAFTTKAAVYALLRGFPGAEILVFVGLYMIFYGIIYALLENDMRRILAYSIVNQVGFMIVGIGIGTELALNGAASHAFAHILYKALLLMSAGSVLYATGRRKCTDLGGLFQSMPLTALCGIVGALAISAFPLTSGFVSKSMISQSAADQHLLWVWLLLGAASAGVFLHAGIKFPWFVFFQKDSGLRPPDPPINMRLAMIFFASLCVALGIFYEPLYRLLPYPVHYTPYTGAHVVTQLQLLLFSGLAFFVMLSWLKRTLTVTLDVDWFYRRLLVRLMNQAGEAIAKLNAAIKAGCDSTRRTVSSQVHRLHGPEGPFARTWLSGSMALWVMVMLLAYLVAYYL